MIYLPFDLRRRPPWAKRAAIFLLSRKEQNPIIRTTFHGENSFCLNGAILYSSRTPFGVLNSQVQPKWRKAMKIKEKSWKIKEIKGLKAGTTHDVVCQETMWDYTTVKNLCGHDVQDHVGFLCSFHCKLLPFGRGGQSGRWGPLLGCAGQFLWKPLRRRKWYGGSSSVPFGLVFPLDVSDRKSPSLQTFCLIRKSLSLQTFFRFLCFLNRDILCWP